MLPLKKLNEFIALNNLFTPDSKILAALSGGMDSVLMVHLLKAAGLSFGIAHCNFQLRGNESINDQQFCKNLAHEIQVPFYTVNIETIQHVADNKVSVQMAARQLRYDWFEQLRQQEGYDTIALAHHQNDAIETILLNLTRGTGIAGLHGILPKNGRLVRPLLFLNRTDIEDLVTENGFAYAEDSSNASAKYARNKIRLEVIPQLKELNPKLEQTFERNLEHFRELEVLLQLKVAEVREALFVHTPNEIHLPLTGIKSLEPKRLLLFNLLQQYGFNKTAVDDIIASLDKHPGRVFESAGYTLVLDRDKLILSKNSEPAAAMQIQQSDKEHHFGRYKLNLLHDDSGLIVKNNPMAVSIDSALLIYPLTVRNWEQGDYFYPMGMQGRKKISDFFIDQKIPLNQKSEIPLLINGNGDVMWICGYRPDDRYKVTDKTKKVTIFELINLDV